MSVRLSKNFILSEFTTSQTAARRGIDNTPNRAVIDNLHTLVKQLEIIRKGILGNKVMIVTSGYRSHDLNAALGGSRTSSHMAGLAVDFICPEFGSPRDVFEAIRNVYVTAFDQLILEYGEWVHFSTGRSLRYDQLIAERVNGKTHYRFAA